MSEAQEAIIAFFNKEVRKGIESKEEELQKEIDKVNEKDMELSRKLLEANKALADNKNEAVKRARQLEVENAQAEARLAEIKDQAQKVMEDLQDKELELKRREKAVESRIDAAIEKEESLQEQIKELKRTEVAVKRSLDDKG